MGDGLVLESGTHNKLLQDANGPYALLVQAQKLREARERKDTDADSVTVGSGKDGTDDMDKKAAEEIPLDRSQSHHSLASEILEKRNKEKEGTENDFGLPYLFVRMGRINSESWRRYMSGTIAATSEFVLYTHPCCLCRWFSPLVTGMVYPAFGIVFGMSYYMYWKCHR